MPPSHFSHLRTIIGEMQPNLDRDGSLSLVAEQQQPGSEVESDNFNNQGPGDVAFQTNSQKMVDNCAMLLD